MENTLHYGLILDYFGTIADPRKVDALLKPLASQDDFQGVYVDGAQRAFKKIIAGDEEVISLTKDSFYPGVRELIKTAHQEGIDVKVYSNGHGGFITKGLELLGVYIDFIDPLDVGSKKESYSYHEIKKRYCYDRGIFVTDSNAEARAASDASLEFVILVDPEHMDYTKVHDAIKMVKK